MSAFKLEVWNGDRFVGQMGDIVAEAMDETLANAVLQAMQIVPVDTGHLKSTIGYDRAKRQGNRLVGRFGATAEYAVYVELGTGASANVSSKFIGPLRSGESRGMAAQPYLRPSADIEFPQLLGRIRARTG